MPGARLPHAWIKIPESQTSIKGLLEPIDISYVKELDENQIKACQWSTLDLCAPDSWTLILSQDKPSLQVSRFQEHCEAIKMKLNIWHTGQDFDITNQSWFADELNQGGILVRPDQHIFMRVNDCTTGEDLITELNRHLGL